jgi:hypothetical protein
LIYRIVVDHRRHVTEARSSFVVTDEALRSIAAAAGRDPSSRLASLKGKIFDDREGFAAALAKALGRGQLARLEPQFSRFELYAFGNDVRASRPWRDEKGRRLGGPGYGWLADVMSEHGLRSPATTNPRLRYYFTEHGWRIVGRHVAAEARRLGHQVKVLRRKNPARSQIAYRDELQLAILQPRGSGRSLRKRG